MPDAMHTPPFAAAEISDERLLAGIHADSTRAFETLFRRYRVLLCVVAARVASPLYAEEIVQDVMFNLWERRASLNIESSLRAYLLTAVRFRAASAGRREQMQERYERDAVAFPEWHVRPPPQPDSAIFSNERVHAVTQAIEALPPRCREIFRLVRIDGLRYDDVATLLGISPRTVDAQMGIALKKLRETLGPFRP